mmetsp:Transcript_30740/g.95113  ORF Transcript_30740/g.95113 Transcript_30740/m.95113 type:complete len:81 (-) Transcript_30740:447-689(-)
MAPLLFHSIFNFSCKIRIRDYACCRERLPEDSFDAALLSFTLQQELDRSRARDYLAPLSDVLIRYIIFYCISFLYDISFM